MAGTTSANTTTLLRRTNIRSSLLPRSCATVKWDVVLLVGSQATFEKRSGAANLIVASIRPASYQKENFAGKIAHRLDAARIAQLTSFVKTGMQELDVPGVAIALVDHGKVVFEGGFGVRQLGVPTPVDAQSLFMIASNTKGLTTLLLARLVDQKQTPVG